MAKVDVSERTADGQVSAKAEERDDDTVKVSVQTRSGTGQATVLAAEVLSTDAADLFATMHGEEIVQEARRVRRLVQLGRWVGEQAGTRHPIARLD